MQFAGLHFSSYDYNNFVFHALSRGWDLTLTRDCISVH